MLPPVRPRVVSQKLMPGIALALASCCVAAPAAATHRARAVAKHHKRSPRKPPSSRRDSQGAPSRGDGTSSGGNGTFPPPNPPAQLGVACPSADASAGNQGLAVFRAALLCLVNQQRAQHGLGALQDDPQLLAAAQHHSDDMVAGDYFGHTSPAGETLQRRAYDSGYAAGRRYLVGEDLAWGTYSDPNPARDPLTAAALVAGWMGSPTHRAVILTPEFRDTGFGIVLAAPPTLASGQRGTTVTEDFGVHG
jgi:uncharacterized protein YkwD